MLLCALGSENLSNHFTASIYFLARNEGGRSKPVTSKYIQQLFSRTWNVPCRVDLGIKSRYEKLSGFLMILFIDKGVEMIMPGDHGIVYVTLLWKMVMTSGQPFTIRENNVTVATGIITKTLPSLNITGSLGKLEIEYK